MQQNIGDLALKLMLHATKRNLHHLLVVFDYYVSYIKRGQSPLCEMSGMVTICVINPLGYFCWSL